jgi:hypothetical protein
LAMKIACFVVRAAPENSKDWARATAREMECIEGDWAALRWALGSLQVLWQPSEPRLASLAAVPEAALQFAEEIRKRTVLGCFAGAVEILCFGSYLYWMRNPTQQLGCYLLVGAMLYMLLQLLVRRGALSARGDVPASANAYRLELKRQLDFHRGGWLWSRTILMVPGVLLFCLGGAIDYPSLARPYAMIAVVFVLLFGFAVSQNLRVARRYQSRLDDLDAVERNEV